MSDILVTSPYRPFTLPNQFKAVFNGYIYCGTVDAVDPSVSQVQVYFVNESGDKVPVAQPLRTNAGGYLVYNGQPAKFVTDNNHSLLVRDALGNQVWYAPNMAIADPSTLFDARITAFKNEFGYSAVENMIAGRVKGMAGAVVHRLGNIYQVDDTIFKVTNVPVSGINDFEITSNKPLTYPTIELVDPYLIYDGALVILPSGRRYLISITQVVDGYDFGNGLYGNPLPLTSKQDWMYSDLRANKGLHGDVVSISGKVTNNDLYNSDFRWNSLSETPDDDYNIIKVTGVDTGRWEKLHNTPVVDSYTRNSNFINFDRGTAVSLGTPNTFFCDSFIGKFTQGSCVANMLNAYTGGVKFTNFTMPQGEFFYVRQYLFDVVRYSGKTMTMIVEAETTMDADYDFYINLRYNSNDSDRVVVVDSDQFTLKNGRSFYYVTFIVPNYLDAGFALSDRNSLELAWRVYSRVALSGGELTIYGYHLIDGAEIPKSIKVKSKDDTIEEGLKYYEVVPLSGVSGFVTGSRVRVSFPFSVRKRNITGVSFDYFDAVSAVGKVSVYDSAGVRTDGITPVAVSYRTTGIDIIVQGAGIAGISASFVIRADV